MPQPLIIFDLDGTLADTAPDLLGTLNRICAPHGLAPMAIEQIGQIAGQGAKAMIARAFELSEIRLSDQAAEELFADFLEDYSQNLARDTRLFDGMAMLLDTLADQDYPLAVCTNKLEHFARKLLGELRIDTRFKAVTGGDTFEFRKPDARHLLETARLADSNPARAIMVGDSINDIKAAQNAGLPSIAVTFGYSDTPAAKLGATEVIDHFDQFMSALERIEKQF